MLTASSCSCSRKWLENQGNWGGRGPRADQTKEEIKICRPKTARFEFSRVFWGHARFCINSVEGRPLSGGTSGARGPCIIKICKSRTVGLGFWDSDSHSPTPTPESVTGYGVRTAGYRLRVTGQGSGVTVCCLPLPPGTTSSK